MTNPAGTTLLANGRGRKVLRVITRLNIGGPARHAVILHKGLSASGWTTRLVHGATGPGEGSFESLLDDACPPALKLSSLGPRIEPWNDLTAFVRLLRLVFSERPDVVHTHTAKAGTLGRLAAAAYNATRPRDKRCLVVHTFHGNVMQGYFGATASRAVRATERLLARMTDRIVTISPRQRSEIAEDFKIASPDRVVVIRLGLDLDACLEIGEPSLSLRRELGWPGDSVVVGAAGRLVPIKDFPTLLEAFALARASVPLLRLVIAGDGEEREALRQLAGSLGIEEHVRFLGWRSDLAKVYEGVDIVALSSRNEGTPVTLIEAMAAGRPVVATAVGGVPDVVGDGESGLLVAAGATAEFADALARLAASPGDRRRLGAAGRAAVSRYASGHLLEAVAELYEQGLREKRGAGPLAVV